MVNAIPRGSSPIADMQDYMAVEDIPGYVHILVGWHSRCKLDGPASEKLLAFVRNSIRDLPRPDVILDVSNVTYINSQAIGIIAVRITRAVRERGGEVHLMHPDPWVRQLITTLKLDAVLPILERLPEFV